MPLDFVKRVADPIHGTIWLTEDECRVRIAEDMIPHLVKRFGIPERLWKVWWRATPLTKIGSSLMISHAVDGSSESLRDKYEQALRIHDAKTGCSVPIMEVPSSLMSVLADQCLYALRIYVLLDDDTAVKRPKIEKEIQSSKLLK